MIFTFSEMLAVHVFIKSVFENVIWQLLFFCSGGILLQINDSGLLVFILLYPLFLIHGFKQQYPRMSLEWILDKPPALGLGPHPHLSSACSPSPSLSQTHTHTETPKALQTLCQFNKERLCHAYLSHSFLARVTTVWVSGKTGRGQADYRQF